MMDSSGADDVLAFYDRTAQAYARRTHALDMSEVRGRLQMLLTPGARILDAGCGSGRDTLAFRQAGFDVLPFDGSRGQVEMARELTGGIVLQLRYREVEWQAEFDAVWACSSLLHLDDDELADVLPRLLRTLAPGGLLYTCFKQGDDISRDAEGRPFNNFTKERLVALIQRCGGVVDQIWLTAHAGGLATTWVNVLGTRPRIEQQSSSAAGET